MAKNQEKEIAYYLYISTDLTQKEIALKAGVTQKTLSGWINREQWEIQKAANTVTRKQQVVNYLMQLKDLNDAIMQRPTGERHATNAESDKIFKITKSIETLEKNVGLSEVIGVCEELTRFAMDINPDTGRVMIDLVNEFVQHKAKQITA
ncbi:MAG: hypothetical protein ACFB2Y_16930 [Fulvivirga sp.]